MNRRLQELEEDIEHLKKRLSDDSNYFNTRKFKSIEGEFFKIKQEVKAVSNVFLKNKIKNILNTVDSIIHRMPDFRGSINRKFFEKEKERASDIFCDKNGNQLLTDEQICSVLLNDDRNLILAGAGSGKTRVIDYKVRYLVNHKKVDPRKIILLTFSKKSASDLVAKISESVPGVEAKTIHSFSYQLVGRCEKKIFDDSKKELESFVIKALVQTLKESKTLNIFERFYQTHFSDLKPFIFYKSLNELREDLRKCNSKLIGVQDTFGEIKARRAIKTLKGEYVRSVDERYIADYLYLQDINYEYERRYPHSNGDYYPDFYLVDQGIYLEHFALTSEMKPPDWFDNPKKYLEGIEWKRKLHQEHGTLMIESFSYLLNEGNTSEYLGKILSSKGVKVKMTLEEEEVYRKISREFSKLFIKFYNCYKLSGLELKDLKQRYSESGNSLFLGVFERFLHHFEILAEQENKMDFNDLIINAAREYEKGFGEGYDYIIVDEFQDTSNLAMKLLDKIYQANPNTVFLSVGDDWQSIYGFNGSDVTILSSYEGKYPGVSVQRLNSNFRSHSKIVNLGKQFISKNPLQIQKDVVSKNSSYKDSIIDFLTYEEMEETIKGIPADESIFVLYRYNDDCPAGHGIFREYFSIDKNRKPVKKPNCSKDISLMTIHGSKGLEARHVFILFPDGVNRKFPSEVEDHFVFNMLKTNPDTYPFSEERRLMYVAITRAQQNLYFVSPPRSRDPNSVFWDELKTLVK
ncbi:MAG: UvrD-helicase domain-containing protein [Bacteriovoracaceae bacterium]